MLTLAFDTATEISTCALVDDDEVLGERTGRAVTLLEDIDALFRQAGASTGDVTGIVVGTGPGSFTSTRIGLAFASGLALSLDVGVAGVSTLDALATTGAYPVIDARRGEVFVAGPLAVDPATLALAEGTVCVGDGARRYRDALVAAGAVVPADDDPRHLALASRHVTIAGPFGRADAIQPIYVRAPDADRALEPR